MVERRTSSSSPKCSSCKLWSFTIQTAASLLPASAAITPHIRTSEAYSDSGWAVLQIITLVDHFIYRRHSGIYNNTNIISIWFIYVFISIFFFYGFTQINVKM
ncbi:hypothetical protein XENOCAPTIV_023033 [Xenoophorus captivus]|uniref:Uncharacterized protein n=1 Tax=Xenoophorus captivus TaxID=1517983 RepID=A0ABV0RSG8_9TELE